MEDDGGGCCGGDEADDEVKLEVLEVPGVSVVLKLMVLLSTVESKS